MSLCVDTTAMVIDAIDESLQEVFQMMAGEQLTRIDDSAPQDGELDRSEKPITVVMGLTGGLQGSLSLSLDAEAAMKWTKALIAEDVAEVDQTVIDAVGELGNMVVGGVKRRLAEFQMTLSLPSVVRAGWASIVFPSGTEPFTVSYHYDGPPVTVLIGLKSVN